MRLLVIGGTVFLGRHITEAALMHGHQVSLFHRGRHGADLYPEAEHVLGDRDGGLEALGDRRFDCVIDTCGYVPHIVRQSADFLSNRVKHYTFVSTVSVYRESEDGLSEESEVHKPLEEETEEITGETYGPLKAACEGVLQEGWKDRSLIVRPGLIVGPWDPTDRFTYWVARFQAGGDVLVPDAPDQPVQWIDVRDLADWIVRAAERRLTGLYNATGPGQAATFEEMISVCQAGTRGRPVIVASEDLKGAGVTPWADLPLWLPDGDGGMMRVSSELAQKEGLSLRPLAQTVADLREWLSKHPDRELSAGISPDRQRELLESL